jgi:hypothetical protein
VDWVGSWNFMRLFLGRPLSAKKAIARASCVNSEGALVLWLR